MAEPRTPPFWTIDGASGSVASDAVATDPQGGPPQVSSANAPITPASSEALAVSPAVGGVFPCWSTAQGFSRFAFSSLGSDLISVAWHNDTNEKWSCELGVPYLNNASATLDAKLSLGIGNPSASPMVAYFWWRHVSYNVVDHEIGFEDPADILGTKLEINGTSLLTPPSAYDLPSVPGVGSVIEPGQSGFVVLNAGDTLDLEVAAASKSMIAAPGKQAFSFLLGQLWNDAASNTFYGRMYLSIDAPFPPGGPGGGGPGAGACPGPEGCFASHPSAGCNDAACCVTVCALDPFCCNVEWDQVCVAEAQLNCAVCPVLCQPTDVPELEPCGQDQNGGCTTPNDATMPVLCGDTVCGTVWAQNGASDTDTFRIEATDPDGDGTTTVLVDVETDFDGEVYVFNDDCTALTTLAYARTVPQSCSGPTLLTANVPAPGFYRVQVSPYLNTTPPPFIDCSANNAYRVTIDLSDCAAPVPCAGDLNGDQFVDGADLGLLLALWGTGGPQGDLNGDGIVNGADLGLLLAAWGPCP